MSTFTKWVRLVLIPVFGIISISGYTASAADSVTLFTPYIRISVPPGQSIDYSLEVINNSKVVQDLPISIAGIPRGWNYTLKSGNYNIGQVAVLPDAKQVLSLKVEVPLKVNKGTYRFRVVAGDSYSLPLFVIVTEKGTYTSEFKADQANMQGHSKSTFTFILL